MVSVIIPTHRGHNHICNAVESVIRQAYQNVEIIVVDDNGEGTLEQQKTCEALKKYIDMQKIVYIIHKQNMNGSHARNTGYKVSKGKYIAFLDDDDCYSEEKLLLQVKQLETSANNIGASYSSKIQKLNGKTTKIVYAKKQGDLLFSHHMHRVSIGTASLLIKREVIENIGGFDPTFKRHQDWEFVGRILNYYHILSCRNAFFIRNLTYRHKPVELNSYYIYLLHYINKLSEISPRLTFKQKRLIVSKNIAGIILKYVKNRKLKDSLEILKSHNKLYVLLFIVIGLIKYPFFKLTNKI